MYMPQSPMRPQQPAQPQNLRASAAQMAADEEDQKPPVVPTTNMSNGQKASTYSVPATGSTGLPTARATSVPTATTGTPAGGSADSIAANTASSSGANAAQDAAYQAAMQKMLQGNVRGDASQQIGAINNLEQQQVGQGQRDLNARLGAAGFGTSGYLGAATENMRADAARQAALDISQAQNAADQRAQGQMQAGLGAANQDRNLQMQEQQFQQQEQALQAISRPGFHDANGDGVDDSTGQSTAQYDATQAVTQSPHTSWMADQGMFMPAGDQLKPFTLTSTALRAVQNAGWKSQSVNLGGRPVTVYQDPQTGAWYGVPPEGTWQY